MQNRNEVIGGRTISRTLRRRQKATRRMPLAAAAAAAIASVFHSGMAKANTADNVTNGQSDLGASGTYGGGSPTTSSDVTFTNVTYSPTAFTLNTNAANPNIGTLDDLDATQTLTIQNTTSGSTTTITLNGGSNSTASPANAADLLYVASGGTLSMGTAGAGTLGLALASSGNFDIAGTANVTSAISGSGFGFTKTGAGSLTLSGPNTYTGNTGVAMGNTTGLNTSSILNLSYAANQTNIINNAANSSALILGGSLTSDATTVLGGGRLTLTGVATSTNTQSFNGMTVGTGGNNIVFANNATANTIALNVGAISRTVGGTLHITQPTGTVSASNGVATTTGTASTILTDANGTAYATVGGTAAAAGDWAAKDATNGFIVGGSTLGGFYTTATSAATFSGNADVTTGFTATAGTTVASIRMNNNTAQTLNINSSGNTTVSTGGILFGSTGNSVITGTVTAKLIAGAGKELVFINTSTGTPQINAVIGDSTSGASSVTYRALQLTSGNGQFQVGSAGNTYTGNTYIESGRVQTAVSTAFGTGAGANVYIDGNTNGQAYLVGGTYANHFYLVGNGWNESGGPYGALRLQGATVSGQVTLLGNATISDQGGTGTISNVIDDGGNAYALTVNGGNTLNLNNVNTYTGGTTLNAGTLVFGNASAFGNGTVTLAAGTLKAGGSGFTLANNVSVTGGAILDMAGNNVGISGNISGATALNVATSSLTPTTLALNGNNSGYSGTVTFANRDAVSFNSASAGSAAAAWVFNDPAGDRVRINIGNATINFGSISGSGQMQNDTGNSTSIVSVGALGTSTTFGGTLKNNGTGILALTKVGNGTLTLTGAGNTYSGGTTISSGTLRANVAAATGTSAVTVSAGVSGNYTGGVLGGSGTVGAVALGAANTTAKQGGIITAGADGSTAGKLTTGAETWNGGAVYNWKVTNAGTGVTGAPTKTSAQTGGNSTTWDDLAIGGALTVGSSGSPISVANGNAFTIQLSSLTGNQTTPTATTGFDATKSYSWIIGTVSSISLNGAANLPVTTNTDTKLITGVNTDLFALDTSGFNLGTAGNALPSGAPGFELDAIGTGSGDNIVLSYEAAPEPGTAMLVLAGGLPTLIARRRRRKLIVNAESSERRDA